MSRSPQLRSHLLLLLWVCCADSALGQTLEALEPRRGLPGAEIVLQGQGFDPLVLWEARVAGQPATVTQVDPTELRFEIPSGARSGGVEVRVQGSGDPWQLHFQRLIVLRELEVSLGAGAPPGLPISSPYGEAQAGRVRVPVGLPGAVVAQSVEDGPFVSGFAVDGDPSLELDAATTATALVLQAPALWVEDPLELAARRSDIDALAETATLAQRVADALAGGVDPLDDDAVIAAWLAAIEAALPVVAARNAGAGAPQPGTAEGPFRLLDFAAGYPRDLSEPDHPQDLFAKLDRLAIRAADPGFTRAGSPFLGADFDQPPNESIPGLELEGSPLDFVAYLYALDPDQFPGRKVGVDTMRDDYSTVWRRDGDDPIAALPIAASSDSARFFNQLSPTARLKSALQGALIEADVLEVPRERPGAYIVRAFSGALFRPQLPLVTNLPDGVENDRFARTLNVMLIVIDGVSLLITIDGVISSEDLAKILVAAHTQVSLRLARAEADGTLDDLLDLIYEEAIKLVVDKIVDKLKEQGASVAARVFGKSLLKLLDVPGKFAKASGFGDRLTGLRTSLPDGAILLSGAQAIETSAIVVDDPWRPRVLRFEPRSGHRGTTVTLFGEAFGFDPDRIVVDFRPPTGTGALAPPGAPAEILSIRPGAIVVKVPEAAADGADPIALRVSDEFANAEDRRFETSSLDPPYDVFTVVPDPMIDEIRPDPVVAGQLMEILGRNFAPEAARAAVRFEADGFTNDVFPTRVSASRILVQAPANLLANDTTVLVRDVLSDVERPSDTVVVTPTEGPCERGATISVNSLLDDEASDDRVTLREAIGWSAGSLGRPPNDDERARFGFLSNGFGPGRADLISISGGLAPPGEIPRLNLGASLPSPGSCDTYSFFGRLEVAAGTTGDGWRISDVTDLTVENLDLIGGADGLALDGVRDSTFRSLTIRDCTGTGASLVGASERNELSSLQVQGCGGHGLHLSGAGVQSNLCTYPVSFQGVFPGATDGNGGDGVRIDGGATGNWIGCGHARDNDASGMVIAADSPGNHLGYTEFTAFDPTADVTGNGGPGIVVEGPRSGVSNLRTSGNGGAGLWVRGSANTPNTGFAARSIVAGIDAAGAAWPNQGAGVHFSGHVSNARLGLDEVPFFNAPLLSAIGGNVGAGIWLDGADVHDVTINHARVGSSRTFVEPFPCTTVVPNQGPGVWLSGGTHDNHLGSRRRDLVLEVTNHVAGGTTTGTPLPDEEVDPSDVGILIEGDQTTGNTVSGTSIGHLLRVFPFGSEECPLQGNGVGVLLRAGAHDNVIGVPGDQVDVFDDFGVIATLNPRNFIHDNRVGIQIESGLPTQGTIARDRLPPGGNRIQNNTLGRLAVIDGAFREAGNDWGIVLRRDAGGNLIGGNGRNQGNTIRASARAGLWIDGLQHASPNLRNRIVGNTIRNSVAAAAPVGTPFEAVPDGVGVLVSGSSGVIVGEPGPPAFIGIGDFGVYVRDSVDVTLRALDVRSNNLAGIVLDACTRCRVTATRIGGNALLASTWPLGGLVLHAGGGNRVTDTIFGFRERNLPPASNRIAGLRIVDSPDNRIGGRGRDRNLISATTGDGVWIHGAGSTGNQVGGNTIGEWTIGTRTRTNSGWGVRIDGGASGNRIGEIVDPAFGVAVPIALANRIEANDTGGVLVDGAATLGNRIVNNAIWNHVGPDIDTRDGGNREQVPPTIDSLAGGILRGRVVPPVPDGSLIQAFNDASDGAEVFLGEGLTTGSSFAFPIATPTLPSISATVTHATTADTSELYRFQQFFGLRVFEGRLADEDRTLAPASVDAPVFQLRLISADIVSVVRSLELDASGSADDAGIFAGFRVYRDDDGDGALDPDEPEIGSGPGFAGDDGTATLEIERGLLLPGSDVRWLITADVTADPGSGTWQAGLADPATVDARFGHEAGPPIPAQGAFPLASDEFSFGAAPDADGDGQPDDVDPCPLTADDGSDRNGDGIGDACQCGDASGDGDVDSVDARLIQRCAIGLIPCAALCDANGDGDCNSVDARLVQRAAIGVVPAAALSCAQR